MTIHRATKHMPHILHKIMNGTADSETTGWQVGPEHTNIYRFIDVGIVAGELRLVAFRELHKLYNANLHCVCVKAKL